MSSRVILKALSLLCVLLLTAAENNEISIEEFLKQNPDIDPKIFNIQGHAQPGPDDPYKDLPHTDFDPVKFGYTWDSFQEQYTNSQEQVFQLIRKHFPHQETKLDKKHYRHAMLEIAYEMPVLKKENYGSDEWGRKYWKELDTIFRRYLNFKSDYKHSGLKQVYEDLFSPNPSKWHVKAPDVTKFDDEHYHTAAKKPIPHHDIVEFDLDL